MCYCVYTCFSTATAKYDDTRILIGGESLEKLSNFWQVFETNMQNLQEKNNSWLNWLKTLSLLKLLTSLYSIFRFNNLPLLQSLLFSVQRENVVLRCLWARYHGLHLYYIFLPLIHFIHIWCHIIKFIHHISWPYTLIKVFPVEFACLLPISLAASTEKPISTFVSWCWKCHKLIALTEYIIKHMCELWMVEYSCIWNCTGN